MYGADELAQYGFLPDQAGVVRQRAGEGNDIGQRGQIGGSAGVFQLVLIGQERGDADQILGFAPLEQAKQFKYPDREMANAINATIGTKTRHMEIARPRRRRRTSPIGSFVLENICNSFRVSLIEIGRASCRERV